VAKGSKREKAKFSGGFEAPTRGAISFSPKPTEGLTLLTAWDLVETYPTMRLNLDAFYSGMGMIDLAYHALDVHDPHPGLFEALANSLSSLRDPRLADRALLTLLWAVLDETGHRPELDADVRSGETLDPASTFGFSPRLGGTLKDEGSGKFDREGGAIWRVRATTVDLLRLLARGQAVGTTEPAAISRATRLLALYYKEVFRVEPLILKNPSNRGSDS
jgi:DNA repair protein RecO